MTERTKIMKEQEKKQKIFLWGVILFAAAAILPLLILSLYDHPSADDFAYAADTYHVWKGTRNLFLVLKEAFATAVSYWYKWQGTYTSAVLMALEPGIFGEQYYRITGFLTIGSLMAGNLVFSFYVLCGKLKESKLTAAAFGFLLSFLMLQWMPSTVEGLYWYNGSMHYTFFYGVWLIFSCLILDLCKEQKTWAAVIKTVIGSLLAIALSGGNYVTGFAGILTVMIVGGFCCFYRKWNHVLRLGIVLIFEIAGFMVNLMCPGTKVRSGAFEESRSVFKTIWNAVTYVTARMNQWMGLAVIVSIVIMLPVIFGCVRRIRKEMHFQFSYPLLVFVASVAFLAAMCCPSYYAMGAIGAGRLVNVIYFAFILLMFFNGFYLCGWLDRKLDLGRFSWSPQWTMTVAVLCFGMIAGCYGNSAGFLAWKCVHSGEALAYSLEADARYNLYINSAGQDVEVSSFSFYPQLLYYEDITEDADDWRNQQVREYFGLHSVVRK